MITREWRVTWRHHNGIDYAHVTHVPTGDNMKYWVKCYAPPDYRERLLQEAKYRILALRLRPVQKLDTVQSTGSQTLSKRSRSRVPQEQNGMDAEDARQWIDRVTAEHLGCCAEEHAQWLKTVVAKQQRLSGGQIECGTSFLVWRDKGVSVYAPRTAVKIYLHTHGLTLTAADEGPDDCTMIENAHCALPAYGVTVQEALADFALRFIAHTMGQRFVSGAAIMLRRAIDGLREAFPVASTEPIPAAYRFRDIKEFRSWRDSWRGGGITRVPTVTFVRELAHDEADEVRQWLGGIAAKVVQAQRESYIREMVLTDPRLSEEREAMARSMMKALEPTPPPPVVDWELFERVVVPAFTKYHDEIADIFGESPRLERLRESWGICSSVTGHEYASYYHYALRLHVLSVSDFEEAMEASQKYELAEKMAEEFPL